MKDLNTLILKIISQIITLMPGFLIAIFLRLAIKQRHANGKDTVLYKNKSNKYTILALDSERYRGDLDVLAKSDKFRVLHIRQGWQKSLIQAKLKGGHSICEVKSADSGTNLYYMHKKTQSLVLDVLENLYKIIDVDCVTTVHFKYLPDYYWTLASERLNVVYVMLYRECNLMSPIIFDLVGNFMKGQKYFHGSHVIVHNQKCKDIFIESNFFTGDKVTVAGALRMDRLIDIMIKDGQYTNQKKRFTLFYFPINSTFFGHKTKTLDLKKYGFIDNFWSKKEEFFTVLHRTILKLAKENPDIEFVIKPKKIFMYQDTWGYYEKIVKDFKMTEGNLDNYVVDPDADVHNLIVNSDIVCGGQSTTSVESLMLGKRVIIPMFFGFTNTVYLGQFPWRDYLDLFDTATNPIEFEKIFYDAMQLTEIDSNIMEKRRELYLQCFDDLSGDAIGKYTKTITDVINQRRKRVN